MTDKPTDACREAFIAYVKHIYGIDIKHHKREGFGAFQEQYRGWQAASTQYAEIVQKMRGALTDIAETAQAASQHQPEQFCEWAYNRASEALSSVKGGLSLKDDKFEAAALKMHDWYQQNKGVVHNPDFFEGLLHVALENLARANAFLEGRQEVVDSVDFEPITQAILDNYKQFIKDDKNEKGQHSFFACICESLIKQIEHDRALLAAQGKGDGK